MENIRIQRLYRQCIRVSGPGFSRMANIKTVNKDGETHLGRGRKFYRVDVRDAQTGDLLRFAGIWSRLDDAIEEAKGVI